MISLNHNPGPFVIAEPPQERSTPERRLMAAVLLRALRDHQVLRAWLRRPGRVERKVGHGFWLSKKRWKEVHAYLFEASDFNQPFSAASICDELDIPLDKLRRRLEDGIRLPGEVAA